MQDITKTMNQLINEIRYYDYMYYIKNTSIISDVEYDLLKQKLEDLETLYPQYIQKNSPTYSVGFQPTFEFPITQHSTPMLSLKNTYILEEILQHIEKNNLWPVILEPKIDGISLSLIYENQILCSGVLRGDGFCGEDILEHIMYTSIPFKVSEEGRVEIRGELYISKKDFILINQDKVRKKEQVFQNSRNATSAIVRNKRISYASHLSFIPYYLKKNNKNIYKTQEENLQALQRMGFEAPPYVCCINSQTLNNSINTFGDFPFDSDGVVIKANNLNLIDTLGATNHHPKGLIAYKFTNSHKEATITNILWQVSRNGKITPVGEITPITLNNATIKKITLHNKNYIHSHCINRGAIIMVERVGATVPQIKKVLKATDTKAFLFTCPYCQSPIQEDDKNFYCKNLTCTKQKEEKLLYFCHSLGLKGLGEKSMKELFFYYPTPSSILLALLGNKSMTIPGWEKICFKAKNLILNLHIIPLLTALGIENLSNKSLSLILNYLEINDLNTFKILLNNQNIFNILNNSQKDIKHMGDKKIKSFINFLQENQLEVLNCIDTIQGHKNL